ncbi:ABC transporter permease subunit [Hoeflea poritis]|uniref:ABC transporter permease subunit n=1 Tax=Hoeflea poritis TaxID=2993659 RepID=A0ABT4VIB1_9HYPH|nr:ABC transporter permease subunit [Hoeflea poritis]MDA4844390.1 ABC transporter permease subunit [Hoeflea poritis]
MAAATAQSRKTAQVRRLLIQAVIVIAIMVIIWSTYTTAQTNLNALGITGGYAFLERATGWSYSFSLLPRSVDDTYLRTLTIGFINTLFLGSLCIVLSTVLGFVIGSIRDTSNLALQTIASAYVQLFRNLPLILQLVFWYAVFIHLPGPRQAHTLGDIAFFSNRGLMLPALNLSGEIALILLLGSILLGVIVLLVRISVARALVIWASGTAIAIAVCLLIFVPQGESIVSVPALKGLRFLGGMQMTIELVAMIVAIVLYSSAYIAEVVRGGLAEVPKGLIEAGQALGLSGRTIWSRIKLPMALRSIVPPLGNQWIFVMKATTIGVAIGFSDLFMIVSTSLTQTGQTLELIAILMGCFLLINFALAQLVDLINRRMQLKAH